MLDLIGCWAPALPTSPDTAPCDQRVAHTAPPVGQLPLPDGEALMRAYLDSRAARLSHSPSPACDPCSHQGLTSSRPSPVGTRVVAVVPLPDGSVATLPTRNPLLQELACRAAAAAGLAWCQPGMPASGGMELIGGWHSRSLEELRAAAELQAAACASLPAPSTPCDSPAALPWAWHAAPPAHQQHLKRQRSELAACAWPAESTSSRCDSQTGSSGGGSAKPALREAAASAPPCGGSQAGTSNASASASPSSSTSSEEESDCDEEVCSASKRRCLGGSSGTASPQPEPAPRATGAPAVQAPAARVLAPVSPLSPSRLSGELPQFSEQELELLQECLQPRHAPAPGPSLHAGARAAASCPT